MRHNSPCINVGSNIIADVFLSPADLDGAPRIVDGNVDIGASEYDGNRDDFDNDGASDNHEKVAGTDLEDATSLFTITNITEIAEGILLQWPTVTDRVYSVYWAEDLATNLLEIASGIAHPRGSFTDTVYQVESRGVYQVGVDVTP